MEYSAPSPSSSTTTPSMTASETTFGKMHEFIAELKRQRDENGTNAEYYKWLRDEADHSFLARLILLPSDDWESAIENEMAKVRQKQPKQVTGGSQT